MAAEHPGVRVRLLGPVAAWRGDTPVPLGSARRLAVFSMLALHANQPVSREELIAAVWGEDAPASATGNVYTYVSELRRALEPSRDKWSAGQVLSSGGGSYCLHASADDIDVMRMYALLDQARGQRIAGDVAGQLASIGTGLRLWHGEALPGVPGPHAEAQRLRLSELRLTGQERYATLLIEVGRYDEAVALLRDLTEDHPLRENLHGLLITALHHGGQHAGARRIWDDLRERLIEETGSEPGEALRQVHDRVLGAEPVTPPAPDQVTLTGRGRLVGRLRRAVTGLAAGRGGSLWLDGEPGIGKTAVLAEGLRPADLPTGGRRGWATGDDLAQRMPLGLLLDCLESADLTPVPRARLAGLRDLALRDETGAAPIEQVVMLVRGLCTTGPLVLVLDDLQWADEATLLAWRALHRLIRHLPLLLVAAGRPASKNRSLALLRRVVLEQGAETLPVQPLDDREAAELATRLAPGLTRPALDQVVADAAGNPYYLHQLVAADGLHPALTAVVGAHLDPYGEDARHLLRTIAFLGEGCTAAEIAAVTGRPMPDPLQAIEEMLTGGLLTDQPGGSTLAFRHPIVRRVLHDGTPTALQVMLHRAVAQKLAESGGSPERVAGQLLAGPVPIDAWAGRWLADNVERLVARAPDEAIAMLRRVTTAAVTDAALREPLTAWLARSLFWQGDDADTEAGWVAARSADPELVAEMRWVVALSHHRRAEHVSAVDGLLAALRTGAVPERWQQRYRLLLARLTPYVAGAVSGPGPEMIRSTRTPVAPISVIR